MTETGRGWSSRHFNCGKLTVNDFLIDSVRLEQSQAVLWLTLLVLSSEEVDSLLDGIGFSLLSLRSISAFVRNNCAACSLNKRIHSILNRKFNPFVEI